VFDGIFEEDVENVLVDQDGDHECPQGEEVKRI
jgi:hypothetical protein